MEWLLSTQTHGPAEVPDLYRLRKDDAQEPPTTLRGRLKFLGPGLIISASIIGSGELIATTTLGAEVGFVLLWMVILSTSVKVWAQIELAQWTILTGKPAHDGYASIGPKVKGLGWINWAWIVLELAKVLQRGGIVGGTVTALSIMVPVLGEPLSRSSLVFWTIVTVAAVILLLRSAKYEVIERICLVAVGMFTAIAVGLALCVPFTEYAYSVGDIASGLSLALPAGAIGVAVAMFGITGVGSDEITSYTYWCMEKGYARWTGPDDGSEERARRARGWISVMRTDAFVSWIVSTVCTMSFFVLGASILHPQGLVPEGNDVILTLSNMYTDMLGEWSRWVFLVGAVAVLGSTLFASSASAPRQWAHTLGLLGFADWKNPVKRTRLIRIFTIVAPTLWAVSYLVVQSPVLMVQVGGVAAGIFLLAVVIAVWRLRAKDVPPEFKRARVFNVALLISSVAIAALACYTVLETFGIEIN
jgi:Mn2+/Fe2+ NRAMP family transporter